MNAVPNIAAIQAKASRSSFYAAMRILPKAERDAMFAIYAFCRAVDDIADDGEGSRPERAQALNQWRSDLQNLYAGNCPQRIAFLAQPVQSYKLRQQDFLAVIDGMAMDVEADIQAPDLETLDIYCDRVASAVGRLSVKIFGLDEAPGFALAHHLGRALQLTNILRDIDEDAKINRLYLPREALQDAGIETSDPLKAISTPLVDTACKYLARNAHDHYAEVENLLRQKPRGRLAAPRLMGAVYHRILMRMEVRGWSPPRTRVSLPKPQLLLLLARYGLFA